MPHFRCRKSKENCSDYAVPCAASCTIVVLGNHDRGLAKLSSAFSSLRPCVKHIAGQRLFTHGDSEIIERNHHVVMGHEHPAIPFKWSCDFAEISCFLRSGIVSAACVFAMVCGDKHSQGIYVTDG